MTEGEDLHPNAHALRPVRVVAETLRVYEATTFPGNPWAGCELYVRRCRAVGGLKDDGSRIVLDVLDLNGDIVQDFPMTRRGLNYLRECLKFHVETE